MPAPLGRRSAENVERERGFYAFQNGFRGKIWKVLWENLESFVGRFGKFRGKIWKTKTLHLIVY
jgi:hypothetical protein